MKIKIGEIPEGLLDVTRSRLENYCRLYADEVDVYGDKIRFTNKKSNIWKWIFNLGFNPLSGVRCGELSFGPSRLGGDRVNVYLDMLGIWGTKSDYIGFFLIMILLAAIYGTAMVFMGSLGFISMMVIFSICIIVSKPEFHLQLLIRRIVRRHELN